MPVGVAMLLEYLGIVFVVGWLWLRHGQRPRRLTVAGGTVAIAGLAMVLDLDRIGRDQPGRRGVGAARRRRAGDLLRALGRRGEREPLPPVAMAWAGMGVGTVGLAAAGWTGAAADDRQHERRHVRSATG